MKGVQHQDRKHAVLSASGADRWINCTPSVRLEEQDLRSENETTSVYAREGTLAHEFADLYLTKFNGAISEKEYLKQVAVLKKNKLYKKDMDGYVENYTHYVIEALNVSKKENGHSELFVEQKLDFSEFAPDGFGTGDASIVSDGFLEIIDLKYGRGLKVEAQNNSQLKLYALGALNAFSLLYDIHTVRLTIVQPRRDSISISELSVSDLLDWGNKVVKPAALKAFDGVGTVKAGTWCRWCAVKASCPALTSESLRLAKLDFSQPELLSDDEILEGYNQIAMVNIWLKAVQDHVFTKALQGKKWDGLKLVAGRSNRKWLDEDSVFDALLKEGFTPDQIGQYKMNGLGKIANLMSVDKFEKSIGHLVIKPEGKPTLVPNTDRRTELFSAKADFE
jgi:hypothetical protein